MIQNGIMIVIGLWFLLIGLGKAKVSKNEAANAEFLSKWGKFFTIAGPTLIIIGVALLVAEL